MKAMTISEAFRTAIDGREVLQGFFTTYSFEPDFFELEVLPLLLGNPALSSNETIRYHQLQCLMAQHTGRLAVVYDHDIFAQQQGARLEVDYLGMSVGNACQHAKLAVLLVRDPKSQQKSVVFCAGSFNLTKAGWWENLEVGHWVVLNAKNAPKNILEPLRKALQFYQRRTPTPVLDAILDSTDGWTEGKDDPTCSFYFSGAGAGRNHFNEFIVEHASADADLEVISPFFSEEADNGIILEFLSRYPKTTVLLPLDDQGIALVDRTTVYEALPRETVIWGQWSQKIRASHFASTAVSRRLHAKIYKVAGTDPWCFVGSVNLSYKAFRENVEAGFLLKGLDSEALLTPLTVIPNDFKIEEEDNSFSAHSTGKLPPVGIVFDWHDERLHVMSAKSGELTLMSSTYEPIIKILLKEGQTHSSPMPELKVHLQRSSLVNAQWMDVTETPCYGFILVSQRNIFCRPNSLPALDLKDLLRIFIGMHDSRKLELINDLTIQFLHANEGDCLQDEFLPELTGKSVPENFFSEFSQVNGAFWELSARLEKALSDNDTQTLAYYLKGQQPDSLRKVVECIAAAAPTNESSASLIVRYLTLLSVSDLLKRFASHTDGNLISAADQAIEALERDEVLGQIKMEEPARFLNWFRGKFYQPVADITRISSGETC